jgi:hypothetical protein
MPTTSFLPYRVQFTSPTPWEPGTTILDSSVVGEHSRAQLQVRNHVLALIGDVNGLFLSAFRADPSSQFFGRGIHEPTLASVRHS